MALQNLLDNLSLEGTQEQMLGSIALLLMAILEKMPRVDTNDRVVVNTADQTGTGMTVAFAGGQTVSVSTVQALGASNKPIEGVGIHLSNAGANYIYDQIVVS